MKFRIVLELAVRFLQFNQSVHQRFRYIASPERAKAAMFVRYLFRMRHVPLHPFHKSFYLRQIFDTVCFHAAGYVHAVWRHELKQLTNIARVQSTRGQKGNSLLFRP